MWHRHVSVCRVISYPTILLLYSLVVVVDCFFPGLPAVHSSGGGQHTAPAPTRGCLHDANAGSSMISPPQSSRSMSAALFSTPPLKPEPEPTLPGGAPSHETTAGSPTTAMEAMPDGQQQRQQGDRPRPDGRMEDIYDALAERLKAEIRARKKRVEGATARGGEGAGATTPEGGVGEEARAVEEALEDGGAAVQQLPPPQARQLWVAVAGAPGSGKTTLAAEVCRRVHSAETPAVCIPMDGYHLYRRELDLLPDPPEARRKRGAHWTFDGTRFLREIRDARTSGAGSFPGFDHAMGDPVESQWAVEPSHAVVLVEGNYLLLKGVDPWDAASELFDETWAIRCPPEVCGERVRKRHVQTGLGDQEALDRVKDNDLPNAKLVSERCPWDEVDVVIDSL